MRRTGSKERLCAILAFAYAERISTKPPSACASVALAQPRVAAGTLADSSALVKVYADESGHRAIRALELLVVSAITGVEVPFALRLGANTRA
jgi:hypothetical protein